MSGDFPPEHDDAMPPGTGQPQRPAHDDRRERRPAQDRGYRSPFRDPRDGQDRGRDRSRDRSREGSWGGRQSSYGSSRGSGRPAPRNRWAEDEDDGSNYRRPPQPRNPRELAASVLLGIFAGPVDDAAGALQLGAERARLDERDYRLARQLTFSVLRHAEYLDTFFYQFFNQAPTRLRIESRIVLRLAAAQKVLLDRIPDHALGDESVRLAKEFFRLPLPECNFINAIVRRMAETNPSSEFLHDLDRPVERFVELGVPVLAEVSRRSSCPPWIVEQLSESFGTTGWESLPHVINGEAEVILRPNALKTTVAELAEELRALGIATMPGFLLPGALRLVNSADLGRLLQAEAFTQGRVYFQDEASQLVGIIANPQPGNRVLDLCSAPGGKATHMAELSGGRGEIVATDTHSRRLALVEQNRERLGLENLQILPWDDLVERRRDEDGEEDHVPLPPPPQPGRPIPGAAVRSLVHLAGIPAPPSLRSVKRPITVGRDHALPIHQAAYDVVVLDAPCSGLGTLRRHPEIRHRLKPDDLKRLANNQLRLLRLATEFVRPGGRLVYSTCSVTQEENLRVLERFFAQSVPFDVDFSTPQGWPEDVRRLRGTDGFFRTWPIYPDLDGFEMVVLKKL